MRQKRLLEEARLLREANRQVWMSYGQKLLLVVIACSGLAALQWLGEQKHAEEDSRKTRWEGHPDIVRDVVNQATLAEKIASTTSSTDATLIGKQLPTNAATEQASGTVASESPCPSVLGPQPSFFASREQMIAAMQEMAEACVWANFRRTIKNATTSLDQAGDNPEAAKFTNTANYIAKEEALAAITARVARQHVEARLVGMVLKPRHEPPKTGKSALENVTYRLRDRIQLASADENSLHVFYELLWYASLLVGVVGASILFMVLLNALPLTSGVGFWTERISDILKRLPSSNVIAVPLVAAVIGGGALAGSIAATEPGGQKRERTLATSEPAPANPAIEQRRGDSKIAITHRGGDLSFPPPIVETQRIEEYLKAISTTSERFVTETRSAQQSAAFPWALWFGALPSLGNRAEPPPVDALQQRVETLAWQQKDLSERVNKLTDLKQLVGVVQSLADNIKEREKTIAGALQSVQVQLEREERVATQSLGQTAEIDPRGFLARTFGQTKYAVGPLVPGIVDAHLKDIVTDEERRAIVNLLTEMRKGPLCKPSPCSGNDFRATLEDRLNSEPRIQKQTVQKFMSDHFPALLKICALPRY